MLANSSFLPLPHQELEQLRTRVVRYQAPTAWLLAVRSYVAGLLSVRLEDNQSAEGYARALDAFQQADTGVTSDGTAAMAHDLALGVRAHAAWNAGRPTLALALLDQAEPERWYQARLNPTLWGVRAPDRYLRGRLLQELGREREALVSFETFGWSGFEQVYAAPARLQRALIHEGLGNRDAAARLYRRVIDIWKDADPQLQPQVEEARKRLARLVGESL